MTDGIFYAQYLSQYQKILSKTRLFGTRNCSKLGRSLYIIIIFELGPILSIPLIHKGILYNIYFMRLLYSSFVTVSFVTINLGTTVLRLRKYS